jgi:uncharacterized protein YuzE
MKRIIQVSHEDADGVRPMYIYYSHAPVAKTVNCMPDGSVAIDFDAQGSVVGIELLHPGDEEIGVVVQLAKEYDLSLSGVFDPGLIAS